MSEYACPEFESAVIRVLDSAAICDDCPVRKFIQDLEAKNDTVHYSQFAASALHQTIEALEVPLSPESPNLIPRLTVDQKINRTLKTMNNAAERVSGTAVSTSIMKCAQLERTRLRNKTI